MSKFGIPEPCQEDWGGMKHNENGAFCHSCEKQVFDTTQMSKPEIMGLMQRFNPLPCLKMTVSMHDEIADDFIYWQTNKDKGFQKRFMLAIIVVFGLSLLSCQNEPQREAVMQIQTVGQELVQEKRAVQKVEQEQSEVVVQQEKPQCELPTLTGEVVEFVDENERAMVEVNASQKKIVPTIKGMQRVVMSGVPVQSYHVREFIAEQSAQEIDLKYDEYGREIPKEYNLKVFPNPFQYETTIQIDLPKETSFQMVIFNLEGKLIQDFGVIQHRAGLFEKKIEMIDVAPGVYLVNLQSTEFSVSKRIVKR